MGREVTAIDKDPNIALMQLDKIEEKINLQKKLISSIRSQILLKRDFGVCVSQIAGQKRIFKKQIGSRNLSKTGYALILLKCGKEVRVPDSLLEWNNE